MFCTKCGKELEETWTDCPYCGQKIFQEEKEDYLIFPHFSGPARETVNTVLKVLLKILECIAGLMLVIHIYDEIKAAEGYKIWVYIIRFVRICGPVLICVSLIEEVKNFMSMQVNRNDSGYSVKTIILLKASSVGLMLLAFYIWANPTEAEIFLILGAIANDSVVDYLKIIKEPIILWVAAEGIAYFLNKKVLEKIVKKEDEKDVL